MCVVFSFDYNKVPQMLKKANYNLGSPFCCVEFLESSCDLDEIL
jgi:hypothetical protein